MSTVLGIDQKYILSKVIANDFLEQFSIVLVYQMIIYSKQFYVIGLPIMAVPVKSPCSTFVITHFPI